MRLFSTLVTSSLATPTEYHIVDTAGPVGFDSKGQYSNHRDSIFIFFLVLNYDPTANGAAGDNAAISLGRRQSAGESAGDQQRAFTNNIEIVETMIEYMVND